MLNLIIGFLFGLAANILTWWIFTHLLVPNIRFSPSISKRVRDATKNDASKFGYRIKMENSGLRSVIDIELTARLRINWPPDYLPNAWNIINVPLEKASVYPYRIVRLIPASKGKHIRHTLRLLINEIADFRDIPSYPAAIKRRAKKRVLSLEDILTLGPNPSLQITAFGYDEFSGARKLFLSKEYTIDDIKEGLFEQNGLEIEKVRD
jgi:hypothetical protein